VKTCELYGSNDTHLGVSSMDLAESKIPLDLLHRHRSGLHTWSARVGRTGWEMVRSLVDFSGAFLSVLDSAWSLGVWIALVNC
jgi:hypothetical protein